MIPMIRRLIFKIIPDSLRLYAKKNRILVKIISNLKGLEVATENTDICLEGVPRCANTFSLKLLKKTNPKLNISHHIHSIGNLKLSISMNVPTFILIRKPKPEIESHILRLNKSQYKSYYEALDYCFKLYKQFYQFVKKNNKFLTVIDFNTVTKRPKKFLKIIKKFSLIDINIPNNINRTKEKVLQNLKNNFHKAKQGFWIKSSTFPNKKRKKLKERLGRLIEQEFSEQLKPLENLYESIKKY